MSGMFDLEEIKSFSRQYLHLLKTDYKGINLTRIMDEDEFFNKQVLDSLMLVSIDGMDKVWPKVDLVYDIGFGGGLPILPLAFHLKDKNFIGLEARKKKVDVVSEITQQLGLSNVQLEHCRFENYRFAEGSLIVSKAMGRIKEILPKVSGGGLFYFYKGPNPRDYEEIPDKCGDYHLQAIDPYELAGTEGRTIVKYKSSTWNI